MRGSSGGPFPETHVQKPQGDPKGLMAHMASLCQELRIALHCFREKGCGWGSLLLVMSGSEVLSLYWAGSRGTAQKRGSRALCGFLVSYFPRFNSSARGPDGNYYRVRIPLSREGGKASKRLKIPSALVHLYRRGAMEDLVAQEEAGRGRCVILGRGRWGFLIDPWELVEDFEETMDRFLLELDSNALLMQRCLRRFNHLHG